MITHVTKDDVMTLHSCCLEEFGGLDGIRDDIALESAINRPRNIEHYVFGSDIFDMAAALMAGIIKDHPFLDGNKRTGIAAAMYLISSNGHEITLEEDGCYKIIIAIAESKVTESKVAKWFRNSLNQ